MRFAAMANIFLLEDDKILSKGISIALKKDEHMVTAVYGYLEALKQYQKQKYDLFLLDINLPDGNGLEFCEKIRETSETPVLFLTANDTEEDMLEGFGVGCDDYISKPFSIEVLRKKVLAVLKRSGVGKFRMKYRDLELDKEKCLVLMKGQEIHLTSTEYKLLLHHTNGSGERLQVKKNIRIIIYLRRGRRISPRQTGSQSLEVLHGNMYPLSENGICIYLM